MKNKGITLIALIITIIVMLILAGVTISSLTDENGIILRANDAKAKYLESAANEEDILKKYEKFLGVEEKEDEPKVEKTGNLDAKVYAYVDKEGTVTVKILPEYYTQEEAEEIFIEKTGTSTIKAAIVAVGGQLNYRFEDFIPTDSGFGDMCEYLGLSRNATVDDAIIAMSNHTPWFTESINLVDAASWLNKGNLEEKLYLGDGEGNYTEITPTVEKPFAAAPDGLYVSTQIPATGTHEIKLEIKNETETKTVNIKINSDKIEVGRHVTLGGKDYIVLYDEGEKTEGAQIISTELQGTYNLGYNDTILDTLPEGTITKYSGSTADNINFEKAVYSYNHAVDTLNTACYNLVYNNNVRNLISDIRCVGSNPTSPEEPENFTPYTADFLNEIPSSESAKYPKGIANGIARPVENENYWEDFSRMEFLSITKVTDNKDYWLASRYDSTSGYGNQEIVFIIPRIYDGDNVDDPSICWVFNDDCGYSKRNGIGLRPVVLLKPGVLENLLK